jgi:hypothetical protein
MPIQAVTEAIRDLMSATLHEAMHAPPGTFSVYVGPPDADQDQDELILFPMRVTPSAEARNADRIRPFPTIADPPRKVDPAVPLDVHYLVTAGSPRNGTARDGLRRLGYAIQAIEAASPISLPAFFQDAVWLSLEPLSTDELSRIWGLFPSFNCRTSFVFRASPIWIDPLRVEAAAAPVTAHHAGAGTAGTA